MSERFVYVIGAAEAGPVKVGIAADPLRRVRELQTGHPKRLRLFSQEPCGKSAKDVEATVHRSLSTKRLSGEWFNVSSSVAAVTVREAANAYVKEDTLGKRFVSWCREELRIGGSACWLLGIPGRNSTSGMADVAAMSEILTRTNHAWEIADTLEASAPDFRTAVILFERFLAYDTYQPNRGPSTVMPAYIKARSRYRSPNNRTAYYIVDRCHLCDEHLRSPRAGLVMPDEHRLSDFMCEGCFDRMAENELHACSSCGHVATPSEVAAGHCCSALLPPANTRWTRAARDEQPSFHLCQGRYQGNCDYE